MTLRIQRFLAFAIWLLILVAAAVTISRARFTADLSAFLPNHPTAEQALLIDQLKDGPASRLLLVGMQEDSHASAAFTASDAMLAQLSRRTAATLRGDARFLSVNNGEPVTAERDRALLFDHRYLLSPAVTRERFTTAGLRAALEDSLDLLSSSAGLMLQPLLSRDLTAEMVRLIDSFAGGSERNVVDGVWMSKEPARRQALLLAETRASGSDIDAQEADIAAIRAAFDSARASLVTVGSSAATARLVVSGPGTFAVAARHTIQSEASRLSAIGSLIVATLLLTIYRSFRALVLGVLPMLSGALVGIATVAAGFGVVHGITLGFGVTLIGEAVDYAIYLFVQGPRVASDGIEDASNAREAASFWPTIAIGVATSVIGFAALMFSGFAGLAQIGLFSIAGLVTAALVTRFVLPTLMPAGFAVRPMPALGAALEKLVHRASRGRMPVFVVAFAACLVLIAHRDRLWSGDLASLSPISAADQATDAQLRRELGAPDVRDLVVVSAPDEEHALAGSERVVAALAPMVADGTLAGVDAASRYLPSAATQRARQAALPDDAALRANFAAAAVGLPFSHAHFDAFFIDVAHQKSAPVLTRADLDGSSLGLAVRALAMPHDGGWTALIALRTPNAGAGATVLPRERLRDALAPLHAGADAVDARLVDIKSESEKLYAGYLSEAIKMSAFGTLAIVIMLAIILKSAGRLARVLVPLALAVPVVAAAHVALGGPLTLFHLVGLLLVVAVGSNYSLFFDRRAENRLSPTRDASVLASLLFANSTTVAGFGLLGFSSVPVLHAIGATVAPGAMLALIFSAVLASPQRDDQDTVNLMKAR